MAASPKVDGDSVPFVSSVSTAERDYHSDVVGSRALGHVLVLAIASGGCAFLVGIEERSEAVATANDAAILPDAEVDSGAPPDDGRCGVGEVRCNGECVNLETSSTNCGSCGHDCLGAPCSRAECEPEQLTAAAYGQIAVVDDTEVFYRASPDEVAVAPLIARNKKTGVERTVTQIGRWHSTLIDGPDIVILENGPVPRLRFVHRTTGAEKILHSDATAAPFVDLALAGDDIYWTTRGDVRHIKRDGTGFQILKVVPKGALKIAIGATEVFYSVADEANVYAIPRAGGEAVVRATGTGTVNSITVVADKIFFSSGTNMNVFENGTSTSQFLKLNIVHSTALADNVIYLYDVRFGQAQGSRIVRYDTTTRTEKEIVTFVRDGRLAIDATHVYFSNYIGALFRVAR